MKFKDIVVLIFLSGTLLYAACLRNNILPHRQTDRGGEVTRFEWKDTILHKQFKIIACQHNGIAVQTKNGEFVSHHSGCVAEALHLSANQVVDGDTVDLIYCRVPEKTTASCFRIEDNGSLSLAGR